MSQIVTDPQASELVFEFELDAPPEKVWRALSIPAFRDKWLPAEDLASAEPVSSVPREEVRFRVREDKPPFLESEVTFQLEPNSDGGTKFRIIHGLVSARQMPPAPRTTEDDWPTLMLAA